MTGHWSWAALLLGVWVGVVAAPAPALGPGASDAAELRPLQPTELTGAGEAEPAEASAALTPGSRRPKA